MRKIVMAICALMAVACGQQAETLFIGTYTDGFYAYDYKSGEQIAKAEMPNPSFLAMDGTHVYAVSEMPDETAQVYAWRWCGNGFELLNQEYTGLPQNGEDPCHVATNGDRLAVSNYSGGSLAVYTLNANGTVNPLDSLIVSRTGGPDLTRQDTPHVHCAAFTPDGKHILFSEFSADAIGEVTLAPIGVTNLRTAAELPADFGPRHLLFDKNGKHFYVIGELSGDIAVFDYQADTLTLKQVVKADQVNARGAADIHFSPDGRYLYASLRLQNDGIAIFEVAEEDGTLAYKGYQKTGPHPRNFAVSEKEVLVACRDNDSIEFYDRDPKTGLLSDSGRRIHVSKPVFIALL